MYGTKRLEEHGNNLLHYIDTGEQGSAVARAGLKVTNHAKQEKRKASARVWKHT